jgi:threonine dehydratase
MQQFTLDEIEAAASIVYAKMQATPQYYWPLLCERLGTEVWVKHENHTLNGTFKIRGGLVYLAHLANASAIPTGVVCATRGNHGQSVGFAALSYGIPATIVVPHAKGVEKIKPCGRLE